MDAFQILMNNEKNNQFSYNTNADLVNDRKLLKVWTTNPFILLPHFIFCANVLLLSYIPLFQREKEREHMHCQSDRVKRS